MDECDEAQRREILNTLESIVSLDAVNAHVLLTSRTNTMLVESGWSHAIKLFDVAVESFEVDIDTNTHVTDRLQYDESLNKWSKQHQDLIKSTLLAKTAGMFRWVDCQLQATRGARKYDTIAPEKVAQGVRKRIEGC